jgi:hypothetical protein
VAVRQMGKGRMVGWGGVRPSMAQLGHTTKRDETSNGGWALSRERQHIAVHSLDWNFG